MTRQRCSQIAVVFLAAAFAVTTFSQNATTSLRGAIKDSSGAVIPGAKVTITNNATGRTLTSTSGSSGEYQFSQIPPATYQIIVAASGFATQTKSAELLVSQPATIDFTVSVQASQEIVNVSAEAQTLNTSDASLGDSMNNTLIQALPS
ncbi:MAG TPA: carboxypeptidase-like regulatory domain-containing protein, partial [Silvibacterium sp.]|nr:carboxypeptidase-like regulatory domain-containing protein [Silvibacterium sp.]